MEFEWDEAKEKGNRAKHDIPFAYATRVFLDKRLCVMEDKRKNYGEARFNALGSIERRLYVVAFTMRRGKHRIISARKANSREQRTYDEFYS